MTDGGQHIHNAGLANAEMWGLKHRLTFNGVSCGNGHRLREVTVFMDEPAVKKMLGILELGMKVPSCHEEPSGQTNEIEPDGVWDPRTVFDNCGRLPVKPPCYRCQYWKPRRLVDGIVCCATPDHMWGDFSCYRPKDGTE